MSKPRSSGVIAAGFLLLAVGVAVQAAEATSPPTKLHKVGDHWTPWEPPPVSAEHYVIQKDDTLWDLAGRWFENPFLWPQIWDANRYILDSHWIYPGDPLVVPGKPVVVSEATPPPVEEPADAGEGDAGGLEGDEQPGAEAQGTPVVAEATPTIPLMPAADPADLYCSGYITSEGLESDLWIAGNETERETLGQGDVVFLNHGRNAGIRAGDSFSIVRADGHVPHPSTDEDLGTYIRRLGRLRVLISHENSATALIEMSCEDTKVTDLLVAWEEIPVPYLENVPPFDRLDPELGGGPNGYVVWQRDELSVFGAGHVIYTDLGRVSGAAPGDFVRVYREREGDLPRMPIGHAVILTVGPQTSAAKITYSVRESSVGDRVELLLD